MMDHPGAKEPVRPGRHRRVASDGGRPVRWAALGFWLLLLAASGRAGAVESVRYETSDGVPIVADLYRPPAPSSRGIILLPGVSGERAEWRLLAQEMSAKGWLVLAPSFRGAGGAEAEPRRGRTELTPDDRERLWRDAEAAARRLRTLAGDSLRTLVLGGANLGATAAAVYASRAPSPPQALLLLSPDAELAGVQLSPLLIGLGIPCLLLVSRDDPASATAHELYLLAPAACTLWEIDGGGTGTQLLLRRERLLSDLTAWCGRG
jgi:pimeloyl-ACP methyl ester carboxylesterase